MLEMREQTQSKGIRLKLMNVTRLVGRVLEITKLDSVFEITSAAEPLPAMTQARSTPMMPYARCA
jgi:anti-anti-sigma regulatory factor